MKPTANQFSAKATAALELVPLQRALTRTTTRFVAMRTQAAAERPDWEALRERGRAVREQALAGLDRHLVELERNVVKNGGRVFWARDADDACRYIREVAERRGVALAVKSKSMATEEIGLNEALLEARVTPIETDLGEFIIQLAGETPSHFLAPAIHWTKEEVAALFTRVLGAPPTDDVNQLTAEARRALRARFLQASMGISGANFAVAETGSIVIVENEGNARLTTSLPPVHVAVVGIEKVVPRFSDLEPLLMLLPRSATGQRLSTYVSILNGARRPGELDGPDEFHLVLLDNGRTRLLADPAARESLLCIRCAACLAACPVYRRAGGHAYGWVYQGPIGSVLTPGLLGVENASQLPFASSLCGACRDACPVKIDIPRMLTHFRALGVEQEEVKSPVWQAWFVDLAARIMSSPVGFALAGRLARMAQRVTGRGPWLGGLPGPLGAWAKSRAVPRIAARPLRSLVNDR